MATGDANPEEGSSSYSSVASPLGGTREMTTGKSRDMLQNKRMVHIEYLCVCNKV